MHLFYITNVRLPNDKGHGVQVVKMAEAFKKILGNDFELVIPDKAQPEGFNSNIKDFYSLKDELPVTKLKIFDPMILSRCLPKFFEGFLFHLGIVIYGIAVFFFCLRHRQAIFYTRDFYLLPFFLLTGVPVYYEAHYFPTNKIAIWLHKLLIPKLAGVVVITNAFVNYFKEFNYKKILVAHDATDITFFKPVPRKPNKKLIIGYIGRLSGLGEDKGGNILINAFRSIKNKNCELLIVGEDEKEKIPGVTFSGIRPYNEMPYYFNLIDIAVIPFPNRSHFRYFMSPLKLFDYLAVGLPIVTSDLPSVREVLSDQNALFAIPGNPESLAKALIRLISDPVKARAMGETNKKTAKLYTWTKRTHQILDFIFG